MQRSRIAEEKNKREGGTEGKDDAACYHKCTVEWAVRGETVNKEIKREW